MSDTSVKGWIEQQRTALARFETEKRGSPTPEIAQMTASELTWELDRTQQHLNTIKKRLKEEHPHVYADLGFCECEHICSGCRDD
jgi:hypothetical protein